MSIKNLLYILTLFYISTIPNSFSQSINQKDSLDRKTGLWIDTLKFTSSSTITNNDIIKYYKVKRGESISAIAEKFGVSVQQIKEWNNLSSGKLYVNQSLKILNNNASEDEFMIAEYEFKEGLPNGYCTFKYMNGKKWQIGQMTDGIKVGLWKIFDENEILQSEGYFENNEENGNWTFYHPNGSKHKEGIYVGGFAEGLWTIYFLNDKKEAQGNFKYDEQDGKWTIWYENGVKKGEGNFINGMKEGFWTYYYENGKKMAEGKHERNSRIGKWKEWDEKGKLTTNTYWEW